MTSKPLKWVRGRMLRVTRLDGCGQPVFGDASVVTTKGFISVGITTTVDAGTEINVTNANGERCVYEPAKPRFMGHAGEVQFCEVDPEVYTLLTGQEPVLDAAGNAIGFVNDTAVDTNTVGFALEVWMGAPVVECEGDAGVFGYMLLPFLQGGVLGDLTVENAAVTFTVNNFATKDGNGWGVGPYDVVLDSMNNPSPLLTPLTSTSHLLAITTDVPPPEPQYGARPLLDPTDDAITDVTPTVDDLEVTFAPDPAGSDPWWIDFGDGTWDYSGDGSNIVHTYGAAGTYEFTAHRGTSTVTDEVTVPGA